MPVLSAKTQKSGFEALAARVEAKRQEEREKEIANEALKRFSIKSLDKSNADSSDTTNFNITIKYDDENRQKQIQTEPTTNKDTISNKQINENEKKSEKSSSIISGNPKIQELHEIQKQLNKSYEPKPLFEPRRPTLESMKSAIEKAKLDEASRNKNVGTEENDIVAFVSTIDASTSVEKFLKKKKQKKKHRTPEEIAAANFAAVAAEINRTVTDATDASASNKNKKKFDVNIKVKAKVDSGVSKGRK